MGKTQVAQKRKTTRVLLGSPFSPSCPQLSDQVESRILDHLKNFASSFEEGKRDWKTHVIFGLNAVCRAVERGALCALLVSRPLQPQILSQQLISMCSQHGVPLLAHSHLGGPVAAIFKLSSLMAMGLRKSAEDPSSPVHALYEEIRRQAVKQTHWAKFPAGELESAKVTFKTQRSVPPSAPNPKESQNFLPLSQNNVFPDPDYPKELDTLKMRVVWSVEDLEAASIKSTADVSPARHDSKRQKQFLVEAQTETVTSLGKVKKAKPKRKRSS